MYVYQLEGRDTSLVEKKIAKMQGFFKVAILHQFISISRSSWSPM